MKGYVGDIIIIIIIIIIIAFSPKIIWMWINVLHFFVKSKNDCFVFLPKVSKGFWVLLGIFVSLVTRFSVVVVWSCW